MSRVNTNWGKSPALYNIMESTSWYFLTIYVPNVPYISPISVPYIIKVKVILLLFEFGKNVKNSDPPPLVKVVYIWNIDFFDFGFDLPPLWTFSTICDIFFGWLPLDPNYKCPNTFQVYLVPKWDLCTQRRFLSIRKYEIWQSRYLYHRLCISRPCPAWRHTCMVPYCTECIQYLTISWTSNWNLQYCIHCLFVKDVETFCQNCWKI